MMEDKNLKVIFQGRVQGVGFRYTVDRLARHFNVTGYVRNLSNGDVELIAEGEEVVLQDFLKAIRESGMKNNILNIEVQWTEAEGTYRNFGIAF